MALIRRASEPTNDDRRADTRDPEGLLRQLCSDDAESRRRAALDLNGDPAAVPVLLAAWADEPDPAAREAMLTTLTGHDRPDIGQALAVELRRKDAGLRNAAVKALQDMPVAVSAVIEELLADPDSDVRILAVMVLSAVPHPDVPRWLRPVVEDDVAANVVAAAVDVAVTLGEENAAEFAAIGVRRFPTDPYLTFLSALTTRP